MSETQDRRQVSPQLNLQLGRDADWRLAEATAEGPHGRRETGPTAFVEIAQPGEPVEYDSEGKFSVIGANI